MAREGVNAPSTGASNAGADTKAPVKRPALSWLIPRKGRRLRALMRVVIVACLIVAFRYEILAWLVAGHNLAWRATTGRAGNCEVRGTPFITCSNAATYGENTPRQAIPGLPGPFCAGQVNKHGEDRDPDMRLRGE